jgi:CTP:molybdopterin cytidylyltransferase MocA
MALRVAMEYQKRQVELFAFADEPDVAVEDHRTVLTFAAEVQVEEEAPIFFDDEVSRSNVAQVFISDIMDVCRQADV